MKFKSTGDVLKDTVQVHTMLLLKWGQDLNKELKKKKPDYDEVEILSKLILDNTKQIQSTINKWRNNRLPKNISTIRE